MKKKVINLHHQMLLEQTQSYNVPKFIFLFCVSILTCLFVFTNQANAGFIEYPTVRLQALDKSTARTITFEAEVGSTIEYGYIYIKVQSCRKSEPLDTPENASFLQIWEIPINSKKSEWLFSGWMFASSPALSAMDHPVYDVWVLDCINKNEPKQSVTSAIEAVEPSLADDASDIGPMTE